ncbi:MAG: DUF4832 domain-containing protein [Nitrospiraceae bacterium]|nr:DUF4832 domain-containing protein [Nitrospiraceae bacterium]
MTHRTRGLSFGGHAALTRCVAGGLLIGRLMLGGILAHATSVDSSSVSSGAGGASAHVHTTVRPREVSDLLYNPGMGFADFHFGFGHPPSAAEYPKTTVAYFRWSWAELEPEEGRYNFALVDRVISEAKAKGESLAIRIVSEYKTGTPQWLLDKGVASVKESDGTFPDYNNPTFLEYHRRLLRAFGERYGQTAVLDHVDIGSVGCWGEWNTACCPGETQPICRDYFPTEANQRAIMDWYFEYFSGTPLVMLHNGPLRYAASRGAGWRGDCYGDYGYFGPDWNHMEHAYPPALEDSIVAGAWKRGPVQFEVCGYIQEWYERGFDLDKILQRGLDWHVSVLNAKSKPVPAAWRSRFEEFLRKMGYRLVLRSLTHEARLTAGQPFVLQSRWENIGVAPVYQAWPLAYRLRNESGDVVGQWVSQAQLRDWLPGGPHEVSDRIELPGRLPSGEYSLDIAVLDRDGGAPHLDLAIEGKRLDRWYGVSKVVLSN